jgi:hypothetical protein
MHLLLLTFPFSFASGRFCKVLQGYSFSPRLSNGAFSLSAQTCMTELNELLFARGSTQQNNESAPKPIVYFFLLSAEFVPVELGQGTC